MWGECLRHLAPKNLILSQALMMVSAFSLAIHHNEAARSFQVTVMMLDVATLASQAAFPCLKLPQMSAAKCSGVSFHPNFSNWKMRLAFFLLKNINHFVNHMYAKL
jgi:hypothetical protein